MMNASRLVFIVSLLIVALDRVDSKGAYKMPNKNKNKDEKDDIKWNRDRFNYMGHVGFGGDQMNRFAQGIKIQRF